MSNRINIAATAPAVYKAMYVLSVTLQDSPLTKIQQELIKIRASQINGCAFCLNMHTTDALKYGETQQRIFMLNAWRETNLYTEEERVMLQMTEEITLVHQHGLSDETYSKAKQLFSDSQIAHIILAAATINTWNRLAISSNMPIE